MTLARTPAGAMAMKAPTADRASKLMARREFYKDIRGYRSTKVERKRENISQAEPISIKQGARLYNRRKERVTDVYLRRTCRFVPTHIQLRQSSERQRRPRLPANSFAVSVHMRRMSRAQPVLRQRVHVWKRPAMEEARAVVLTQDSNRACL